MKVVTQEHELLIALGALDWKEIRRALIAPLETVQSKLISLLSDSKMATDGMLLLYHPNAILPQNLPSSSRIILFQSDLNLESHMFQSTGEALSALIQSFASSKAVLYVVGFAHQFANVIRTHPHRQVRCCDDVAILGTFVEAKRSQRTHSSKKHSSSTRFDNDKKMPRSQSEKKDFRMYLGYGSPETPSRVSTSSFIPSAPETPSAPPPLHRPNTVNVTSVSTFKQNRISPRKRPSEALNESALMKKFRNTERERERDFNEEILLNRNMALQANSKVNPSNNSALFDDNEELDMEFSENEEHTPEKNIIPEDIPNEHKRSVFYGEVSVSGRYRSKEGEKQSKSNRQSETPKKSIHEEPKIESIRKSTRNIRKAATVPAIDFYDTPKASSSPSSSPYKLPTSETKLKKEKSLKNSKIIESDEEDNIEPPVLSIPSPEEPANQISSPIRDFEEEEIDLSIMMNEGGYESDDLSPLLDDEADMLIMIKDDKLEASKIFNEEIAIVKEEPICVSSSPLKENSPIKETIIILDTDNEEEGQLETIKTYRKSISQFKVDFVKQVSQKEDKNLEHYSFNQNKQIYTTDMLKFFLVVDEFTKETIEEKLVPMDPLEYGWIYENVVRKHCCQLNVTLTLHKAEGHSQKLVINDQVFEYTHANEKLRKYELFKMAYPTLDINMKDHALCLFSAFCGKQKLSNTCEFIPSSKSMIICQLKVEGKTFQSQPFDTRKNAKKEAIMKVFNAYGLEF